MDMRKLVKSKKGISLEMVPTVVVLLVVIAIVLSLGSTILENVKNSTAANSYAYNSTLDGQIGLETFSGFQNTIAIVVVAGVILAIIFGVLVRRQM